MLSTSHYEFNGARSCAHARKTIPLAPIHLFTKQMVPSLCPESLTRSLFQSFSSVFCMHPIKCFLPSITFLCARRFFYFLVCFFRFHCTLFRGLAGACMNSGKFFQTLFLCIHFFVESLTHFLAKLVSALSHVCSTYHTNFCLK